MSAEATITASLSFAKTASNINQELFNPASVALDVAGSSFVKQTQSIPTTAGGTAINLGSLTGALGLYLIKNLDPTNYVTLMPAASGVALTKIPPGGFTLGYFASGVTAPALLANTAACVVQYFILPA